MVRPPLRQARQNRSARPRHGSMMRRIAIAAGVAVSVSLGAGGCHNAGSIRTETPYQIKVEEKTFRTEVPLPWVIHRDGRRRTALPQGFLADYQRRGRTPMRLMPPSTMTAADTEAVQALVGWLESQGVPTEVLDPITAFDYIPPSDGHVGLAFRGYTAIVPNCGDWSGETGFNPSGMPHTNFGCSITRNIGLMLSDPGDLERARSMGNYDAGRMVVILEKYRAGETTETRAPTQEEGAIADVEE